MSTCFAFALQQVDSIMVVNTLETPAADKVWKAASRWRCIWPAEMFSRCRHGTKGIRDRTCQIMGFCLRSYETRWPEAKQTAPAHLRIASRSPIAVERFVAVGLLGVFREELRSLKSRLSQTFNIVLTDKSLIIPSGRAHPLYLQSKERKTAECSCTQHVQLYSAGGKIGEGVDFANRLNG